MSIFGVLRRYVENGAGASKWVGRNDRNYKSMFGTKRVPLVYFAFQVESFDGRQGGKFQIPKAGCHVIGRRATGSTIMIYCSKVCRPYIFLNRTRAADVTTEPLF